MNSAAAPAGVFTAPRPRLFTIDPAAAFLNALARGLRASIAAAPGAALADALVYLPTRRAVRALGGAFVETAPDGRASLLPRIRALGDIDEDEFVVFGGPAADELDLAPAMPAMERRLTLARMVAARDRAFDGHERWAGALAAADELGKLLDSFYTEEVSAHGLRDLAPESLATHWQKSLDFLTIITEHWPKHLQELGLMDPADRRVKLIDRQRLAWEKNPPQTPVIVAGTTGSTPAVARMMKTVAAAPMGCVVLPGLDLDSGDRFWETIDEPHPQSGLKHLLDELGVDRGQVAPWPSQGAALTRARGEIISVALRPAGASDSWRDWALAIEQDTSTLTDALADVELVEASDEEREAGAIALAIRGAIEAPEKTVTLVTPDRDLARRVSLKLRRWKIAADDSAGVPFANSPCGTYLRLVARWLMDPSDCVALMAVLRHPLFGGGLDDGARRRAAGAMDRALRGLRPRPGAQELRDKVAASRRDKDAAAPLLDELTAALEAWPRERQFSDRLGAHLAIAERLAATGAAAGDVRLWGGEDGEAGAAGLAQISGIAAAITHDAPTDYPGIFDQLIAKIVVRRRAQAHPRINILGPLEARLQQPDLVILGGLNEGVWPRDAAIDPFLSRPMRRALGLPSPERRIGLAAHDFAQAAAAPSVMMTRSMRAGGKPTKPSRWIVRLKNILTGAKALSLIDRTHHYETLVRRLDEPQDLPVKIPAPSPRPPLNARPTEFYVTRIEKLLRDPYAIYGRTILRLKKMDAHNEQFDARHMGNLFHRIFEKYAAAAPLQDDAADLARLGDLYAQLAPEYGLSAAHAPFWGRRADAALSWFRQWDADRRLEGAPFVIEGGGEWRFDVDGRAYTLGAKADRIDRLTDGSAFIIDYKTGAPPTLSQTKKFSPQLPLTGLIVRHGGFPELGCTVVGGFQYLRVLGRKDLKNDDVGAVFDDAATHIAEAETSLKELLRHFNNPQTAYLSQPRPQYMDEWGEYDHLARRRERNAQGGDV